MTDWYSSHVSAMPEGVGASLRILARHRALFDRDRRSGWGVSMDETDILRVVRVFEDCTARWALVGAHAVGLLTEPRATVDFDFIVEGRKTRAVLRGLEKEFGTLDPVDIGAAVRLRAIDIDLIRSDNHALFREALERAQAVGSFRVPPPEAIMALKFLSAVNPWRNRDKRAQDVVDLSAIYRAVGAESLDRDVLNALASLVYPGAEKELEAMLDRVDRGEPIPI